MQFCAFFTRNRATFPRAVCNSRASITHMKRMPNVWGMCSLRTDRNGVQARVLCCRGRGLEDETSLNNIRLKERVVIRECLYFHAPTRTIHTSRLPSFITVDEMSDQYRPTLQSRLLPSLLFSARRAYTLHDVLPEHNSTQYFPKVLGSGTTILATNRLLWKRPETFERNTGPKDRIPSKRVTIMILTSPRS